MDEISFVPVSESHIEELTLIYNYYIAHSTATFHIRKMSTDEMRKVLLSGDSRFCAFTIFQKGKIIGYVMLSRYKPREAYDSSAEISVYFEPEATHRGLGKTALDFIEKFALENNFHSLLATITGENDYSVRLFEKSGYQRCAHLREVGIKFDRIMDVFVYQKILGKTE